MALCGRGLAWLVRDCLLAVSVQRRSVVVALLLGLAAAPASALAQVADPASKDAIEKTISGQIDAFARDDATTAFSFAAPSIQRQFGSPDRFMMMVMRGYPMVYRPSSVQFLQSSPNGTDSIMQAVQISDSRGKVWIALYNMRMIGDGDWRIAGVRMREIEAKLI